jgi:predicted kinase
MAKVIPLKPLFIMLYGFPGAGKTYFARQLCDHLQAAHVQGDRIRAELFENPRFDTQENAIIAQLTSYMTGEFLSAGISVVYDMNAMRSAQRHAMRDMARRLGAEPLVVWFQIDLESSFARSIKRDRRKADDKYAVPMDRSTFDNIVGHMVKPGMVNLVPNPAAGRVDITRRNIVIR